MFGPYKTLGSCFGAFPEKIKLTHCFFRCSDEGTKKYFCVHLYIWTLINCHASLICKPRYLLMKNSNRTFVLPSSFSHGRATFSGQAKQGQGRLPFPLMMSYWGDKTMLGLQRLKFLATGVPCTG